MSTSRCVLFIGGLVVIICASVQALGEGFCKGPTIYVTFKILAALAAIVIAVFDKGKECRPCENISRKFKSK